MPTGTRSKKMEMSNADLRYLEMKLWLSLDDEAQKRTKVGLTQQWYCLFRTNTFKSTDTVHCLWPDICEIASTTVRH